MLRPRWPCYRVHLVPLARPQKRGIAVSAAIPQTGRKVGLRAGARRQLFDLDSHGFDSRQLHPFKSLERATVA